MSSPEKILVVDDDVEFVELVSEYLTENGYQVDSAADGLAVDQYIARHPVDLMILDIMMPGEDGLSIARRLSNEVSFPIIILSAKGEDMDKVIGLELGADDYITKPFNPRELLARIKAHLRRTQSISNIEPEHSRTVFTFDNFLLNCNSGILTKNNEEINLTHGESNLLCLFAHHPQKVFSRDQLMEQLKGHECQSFDRSIDIRINRLRKKIESDHANPRYIRTVWGKGYLFSPDVKTIIQ